MKDLNSPAVVIDQSSHGETYLSNAQKSSISTEMDLSDTPAMSLCFSMPAAVKNQLGLDAMKGPTIVGL